MFKFRDREAHNALSHLSERVEDIRRRLGWVPRSYDIYNYTGNHFLTVDDQLRELRNDLEAVIEHLGLEHVSQTVTPPHLRKKTRRAIRKG